MYACTFVVFSVRQNTIEHNHASQIAFNCYKINNKSFAFEKPVNVAANEFLFYFHAQYNAHTHTHA